MANQPTVQLYQGDCLEFMKTLAPGMVDAVVTDPPYGIGESSAKVASRGKLAQPIDYGDFNWDTERIDTAVIDWALLNSDYQVIFGGNYYADVLPASSSWVVWDKLNGSNDFADCEMAWTSHKKAARMFRYMWNGMIKQKPEERFHPTQKPLDLMRWVVKNYTPENSTVFDPFMGSGTTGVACMQLGAQLHRVRD